MDCTFVDAIMDGDPEAGNKIKKGKRVKLKTNGAFSNGNRSGGVVGNVPPSKPIGNVPSPKPKRLRGFKKTSATIDDFSTTYGSTTYGYRVPFAERNKTESYPEPYENEEIEAQEIAEEIEDGMDTDMNMQEMLAKATSATKSYEKTIEVVEESDYLKEYKKGKPYTGYWSPTIRKSPPKHEAPEYPEHINEATKAVKHD